LPTSKDSTGNLKDLSNSTTSPKVNTGSSSGGSAAQNGADSKSKSAAPTNGVVQIICKKLTLTEEFKCRADEIYRAFVDINVLFLDLFFLKKIKRF
jgi:hypothetical protein